MEDEEKEKEKIMKGGETYMVPTEKDRKIGGEQCLRLKITKALEDYKTSV